MVVLDHVTSAPASDWSRQSPSKVRVQGDGSTITEILWKTRGNASEGAMIKFAQGGARAAC